MSGFYNHEKMRALTMAAKTSDAYSADAWGPVLWVQAAQMLLDMGLAEDEVEGVLRSKLTRYARDAFGEPSTYLGQLAVLVREFDKDALRRYLDLEE